MNTENPYRVYPLSGGCQAIVRDETRHYYGGYYHVRLQVEAEIALMPEWFESESLYKDALNRHGSAIRFYRLLEKMAVPEWEIVAVRQSLINDFEINLVPYLLRPDFPRRFVTGECAKSLKSSATRYPVFRS